MKTLEFDCELDPKRKLMITLFWTNRKAARTEGCAPFLIKKIITPENTYTPTGTKLLKLTDEIFNDLYKNIEEDKPLFFEISIGKELIEISLDGNIVTVSTQKSDEIEEEIIDKLNIELSKNRPVVCESFEPRITPMG